jgi:hypothetical protein
MTMSSTSIKVTWGDLPSSISRGIVTGYKVIYRLHNQPSEMVENVKASSREYIIHNLDPATSYDVRVLAGNMVGFPDLDDQDLPWVTEMTPSQSTGTPEGEYGEFPAPPLTEPVYALPYWSALDGRPSPNRASLPSPLVCTGRPPLP